jgi:hypothetical protein
MQYVRDFPDSLQPQLEAIVVRAQLGIALTGHHGGRTARADAVAFAQRVYCACAAAICSAVSRGDVPYLDLAPKLGTLKQGVIRDTYARSDLEYWSRYEDRCGMLDFTREAQEAIDRKIGERRRVHGSNWQIPKDTWNRAPLPFSRASLKGRPRQFRPSNRVRRSFSCRPSAKRSPQL